jgi:hypothetical protein
LILAFPHTFRKTRTQTQTVEGLPLATRNYQTEPKHRIPFTALTSAQIDDKLASAIAAGPSSTSAFSGAQVGQSLPVTARSA